MTRPSRLLLPLVLTAAAALGAPSSSPPPADLDALVDSLIIWNEASRPDLVDSLAGPAIAQVRADGDSTHLLPLLLVRGATRAGFGRALSAETDLREALDLAVARDDTMRRMQVVRWLSVAVGRQGRMTEAGVLYRELEALAATAGDSIHLGWAWVGIAYDHYLGGRTDSAGSLYGEASGVLERSGEPRGAVWARNGQALALRQAGEFHAARRAFAQVVELAGASGYGMNEALALGQLGRLDLQLGDPGLAIQRFERAVAINRADQRLREGLLPYIDIATAEIMQGRFHEAEARLDTATALCRENGLRDLELLATAQLADALLAQGRPGGAARRCREALAGGEMPSLQVGTEVRLRLARALAARDSLDAAVNVLSGVMDTGAGAVSLELRTAGLLGAFLVDAGRPAEALGPLQAAAAVAADAGVEAERVVLLTQIGRAQFALQRSDSAREAFAEAIASWEQVRSWPSDPVWREHRGTISGSLFALATAALLAGPADDPPDLRLSVAWACAQRHKARTLQERRQGPGIRGSAVPVSLALSAVQSAILRPGEVLIDLVEGEGECVMFCVTTDTAMAFGIPGRRELQPRMERLVDVVTSAAVDDPSVITDLVASTLEEWPEAVTERLAAADLVFWCPDGSWHQFPSALLPSGGGISRLPAADVLAQSRLAARPAPHRPRILAVSGPDPRGGGPLPGAEAETRWLASRLQDVQRQNLGDGSAIALDTAAWQTADVLHLAAHTRLDPWQPWNTTVTLAPGPDGAVGAAEVATMSLQAQLTVLAGCTTAGSHVVGGEGLIGMAGAFMAAHSSAVVATAWPVDDIAASHVTAYFYEGLAEGLPAALALARAQDLCRAEPATAAPRHWAAYELFGDGAVTIPVRPRRAKWPWALGLALVSAMAAAAARR